MSENVNIDVNQTNRRTITDNIAVALFGLLAAVIVALIGFVGSIVSKHYEGKNSLQLKREEFQVSLILQAVKTDDIKVAEKNLEFFLEAGFLDDKNGKIKKFLSKNKKIPFLPPSGNIHQDKIYKTIRIEGLHSDKATYSLGEEVKIYYQLVNRSDKQLIVPENNKFSQPFHLLGSVQHWIQRLGEDSVIAGIPDRVKKIGSRYGAGGTIVPTGTAFNPKQSLAFSKVIDTKGYPPGYYRYYVEYQTLNTNILIQAETVDFRITE